MAKDQRKVANFVVNRGVLLRLSIPFFLMAGLNVAILLIIGYSVMKLMELVEPASLKNMSMLSAFLRVQHMIVTIGTVGVVILMVLCLLLWLHYSHRIFGPSVPLRRHVQRLAQGDYSSRIELRKMDEFKDLAEDLNQLAEELSNKYPKT